MTVHLVSTIRDQLFDHLQKSYPNEGGGFLFGDVHGGDVTIREIRPVSNTFASEEQYHRYAMTPLDWAHIEDEADARGLTLVGYFHSHPDSPAIPSEYDRVHALPNFCYLITAVYQAKAVDLRAWQLTDDRSRFDALELNISA